MLPFEANPRSFIKTNGLTNEEQKARKTSCSQQAIANQIVLGSLATNPNAGQVQQSPAKQ